MEDVQGHKSQPIQQMPQFGFAYPYYTPSNVVFGALQPPISKSQEPIIPRRKRHGKNQLEVRDITSGMLLLYF